MQKDIHTDKLESLSLLYDNNLDSTKDDLLFLNNDDIQEIQNWGIISATLKNELTPTVNVNFLEEMQSKLALAEMDSIEDLKEESIKVDDENLQKASKFKNLFKKVMFYTAEIGVAASVTLATIVGWQSINSTNVTLSDPQDGVRSLEMVPLASYRADALDSLEQESDIVYPNISFSDIKTDTNNVRKEEVDRVNGYLNVFMLEGN